MKRLFIGISGVAGSGKDLFFKLLKNELNKRSIDAYRYSLDDSQKAFEHAKTGEQAMKIIIEH